MGPAGPSLKFASQNILGPPSRTVTRRCCAIIISMLVDSHCHLHDKEFFSKEQAEEMLSRAHEAGVEKIICIGTSHEDSLAACEFASHHDNVYWTYGIHPENTLGFESTFSSVGLEFSNHFYTSEKADFNPPVAIGEVGLDYHYEGYDREAQIRLFEQMLQLALDHNLPVSFHVREAFEDFFAVVKNFPKVHGVVHSFTDSKKSLRRVLETTDFYVGVNGLATYSTLPLPPLERILLETDAPFLAPVPHRGEKNEPAYVAEVAKWLSKKLDCDAKVIAKATSENAHRVFGV